MNPCVLLSWALAVFFCTVAVAAGEAGETPRDLGVIRDRIIARYIPTPGESLDRLAGTSERYARTLREDGSWHDVDYTSEARSRWQTANHLARVRDMTAAYCAPGSPLKDKAALEGAILKALDFWLAKDFRNPNWWWNEIGVQLAMGPALLMLDGTVTAGQKAKGIEIMKRGKWSGWTGQNLI